MVIIPIQKSKQKCLSKEAAVKPEIDAALFRITQLVETCPNFEDIDIFEGFDDSTEMEQKILNWVISYENFINTGRRIRNN